MIKITKENINDYYKTINTLIDNYFKMNITAKGLKQYFKKGSKNVKLFLEQNELTEVESIDKILHDVISDRYYAEIENVSMSVMNESVVNGTTIFSSIKPSTIIEEKQLANLFHTSLSNVVEINSEFHHYQIADKNYLVFSTSDMEKMLDYLHADKVKQLLGVQVQAGMYVKDIVDLEKLNSVLTINPTEIKTTIASELRIDITKEIPTVSGGYLAFEFNFKTA